MTLKHILKEENNIKTIIMVFSDSRGKRLKCRKNSIPRKYLNYTVLEYRIYDRCIEICLKGNI